MNKQQLAIDVATEIKSKDISVGVICPFIDEIDVHVYHGIIELFKGMNSNKLTFKLIFIYSQNFSDLDGYLKFDILIPLCRVKTDFFPPESVILYFPYGVNTQLSFFKLRPSTHRKVLISGQGEVFEVNLNSHMLATKHTVDNQHTILSRTVHCNPKDYKKEDSQLGDPCISYLNKSYYFGYDVLSTEIALNSHIKKTWEFVHEMYITRGGILFAEIVYQQFDVILWKSKKLIYSR